MVLPIIQQIAKKNGNTELHDRIKLILLIYSGSYLKALQTLREYENVYENAIKHKEKSPNFYLPKKKYSADDLKLPYVKTIKTIRLSTLVLEALIETDKLKQEIANDTDAEIQKKYQELQKTTEDLLKQY